MPMQTSRRVTAVTLAAGALLLAAFAVAPSADAATLYACVKKNGTAHIYGKKPKCKKHETKLSWNTEGVAGKNGLNGLNGLNGAAGKEGPQGKEGAKGTARGYAVVSDSAVFEGPHPGFSEVFSNGTGEYCLVPAPGSGLDQSGATSENPGLAAAVAVDWGWSGGNGNLVQLRQRPFGNCPAADFEVYTFKFVSGAFEFSSTVGFHIIVP